MVHLDELHVDKFRALFLKILGCVGVTEIGTFSAAHVLQSDGRACVPNQAIKFTLHTNVGVKAYSMLDPQTASLDRLLAASENLEGVVSTVDTYGVVEVVFPGVDPTVFVFLPKVIQPEGTL